MKTAFALIASLALPTAGLAACPTGADLETGIRFLSPEDESETFTRFSPNVVVSEYLYEPGGGSRNLLSQGVYLIQNTDIEDGNNIIGDGCPVLTGRSSIWYGQSSTRDEAQCRDDRF